jgi:hypothetical protein
MRLEMNMKPETLLKLADWFEERAKHTECKGCQRRALRLARVARQAAKAQQEEVAPGQKSSES